MAIQVVHLIQVDPEVWSNLLGIGLIFIGAHGVLTLMRRRP